MSRSSQVKLLSSKGKVSHTVNLLFSRQADNSKLGQV